MVSEMLGVPSGRGSTLLSLEKSKGRNFLRTGDITQMLCAPKKSFGSSQAVTANRCRLFEVLRPPHLIPRPAAPHDRHAHLAVLEPCPARTKVPPRLPSLSLSARPSPPHVAQHPRQHHQFSPPNTGRKIQKSGLGRALVLSSRTNHSLSVRAEPRSPIASPSRMLPHR